MTATNSLHILTVDDNPVNLFLITTIVKKILPEAQIHEAKDGAEALSTFHSHHPNLIFMDIKLPDMTGYDVIEKIRSMEREERTPIIVVSANTSEEGEYAKYADMIDGHLTKPIKYDGLQTVLLNFFK